MPDEIVTTDQSLAQGADVTPGDGSGADSQNVESLTLDELNQVLGKNFPSKEAALKSVKDTYSYVGSVGQLKQRITTLEGQGNPAAEEVSQLKTRVAETEFYSEN